MLDDRNDQLVVETYLGKLRNTATEVMDYQLIQDGISGASLYQIRFPDGEALLKVTSVARGPVPLNRARRELAFYRDLAGQIPLPVPHMLGMYEDVDSVALLMAVYRSSPPPALWSAQDYLDAAHQLGKFHATFWAKTEQLSQISWLAWYQREDFAEDIKQAHIYWQTLRAQPHFADVLTEQDYAWLQRLLTQIEVVPSILRLLPLTVCHGDCITSNILCDSDGHFVWADWQEVRLARGPEDLAFFLQRASTAGGAIQRDAIINAYHLSLEERCGQAIQLSDIYRVMEAADLWSRVLYWPAYLVQASEALLAEMIQQIRVLAVRLDVAA